MKTSSLHHRQYSMTYLDIPSSSLFWIPANQLDALSITEIEVLHTESYHFEEDTNNKKLCFPSLWNQIRRKG